MRLVIAIGLLLALVLSVSPAPSAEAEVLVCGAGTPVPNHCDVTGDGVNDELDIQSAIDSLPAGGLVQLRGDFVLGGTVYLDDDIELAGEGPSTRLSFDPSVGDVTMITNRLATPGSRAPVSNRAIVVRDLHIDGGKNNRGPGDLDIWTVGFSSVENLTIRHVTVVNGWTAAIRTEFCEYVLIQNNRTDNSGDDGIAINEETAYAIVEGNFILNAGATGSIYGFPGGIEVQDGSHDVIIRGNFITNARKHGIDVRDHAGKPASYNVVMDSNIVEGSETGIFVWPTTGALGKAHDISISNNLVKGNLRGIRVDDATNITITGNQANESGRMGIDIRADADYVRLQGNYCLDNGQDEAGESIGISIKGTHVTAEGNECRDTRNGGQRTQSYGMRVFDSAEDALIWHNRFDNNVLQGLHQSDAPASAIIQDNIP